MTDNLTFAKFKEFLNSLNAEQKAWLKNYVLGENAPAQDNKLGNPISIFYGTETGNSKAIAKTLLPLFKNNGAKAKIHDMETFKFEKIQKEEQALFILSTHGEGEMPETAKEFYEKLTSKKPKLDKLKYAVIALGDTSYPLFCEAGKNLDKTLESLGAKKIAERVDFDLDFNEDLQNWIKESFPKFDFSKDGSSISTAAPIDINLSGGAREFYTAKIASNIILNDEGSNKETRHIELIPEQEVHYQPGDSVGIVLHAEDERVQKIKKIEGKIAPRLYSIASSKDYHDDEIHLTVSVVSYKDKYGKTQKGLCSNFLSHLNDGDEIKFYIQPNQEFRLADDDRDIIMVGPGTGIAPFRSFLAERENRAADGKNWLFFGEQYVDSDFLYQIEFQEFFDSGLLNKISLAFSRDQKEKIYVQHRMEEEGKELFNWLENGAFFYVCGDKENMAKDVEAALLKVISTHGKLNDNETKDYLNRLKDEGRYLRDVY